MRVEAPELCGRFSGRIVRQVDTQAKTPAWMVDRLARCGQRSVTALVDISNYVMFEYGRPSHVFDLDKIHDRLVVRWGRQNALRASFLAHLIMWVTLGVFGLLARFWIAYLVGLVLIIACLVMEHWLARKRSLKWIDTAFFRLNALISVIFLVVTLAEVAFPRFQLFTP